MVENQGNLCLFPYIHNTISKRVQVIDVLVLPYVCNLLKMTGQKATVLKMS